MLCTTLKSNGKFCMGLTNIEGIERLECITVFTEVASQLSGNLHLFFTELCSLQVKKNLKCDSEEFFERKLDVSFAVLYLRSRSFRGLCVVFLGKTLYSHGTSFHPGV